MSKLPLDDGNWSGEITFQSPEYSNVEQSATCQLEVKESTEGVIIAGKIHNLSKSTGFGFSIVIDYFTGSSNMTSWKYSDKIYKDIWGTLVAIDESYLALGISYGNEFSFSLSIEPESTNVWHIKGFSLRDQANVLSWSFRLYKFDPRKVVSLSTRVA